MKITELRNQVVTFEKNDGDSPHRLIFQDRDDKSTIHIAMNESDRTALIRAMSGVIVPDNGAKAVPTGAVPTGKRYG